MKVAEHHEICTPFFEQLRTAPARLLMLDYDGTLAPFTVDRARAFPYREIPQLIAKIMGCETRVVLISGRPATELVFLSGIHPHPEIWGSHGVERLFPDDSYHVEALPARQRKGLAVIDEDLRAAGLGARLENKPGAIAVHWRGVSLEERTRIEETVRRFSAAIDEHDLRLIPFDGGLEIRGGAKNKGDAVHTVLSECETGVAAAYLGDDQTDEDAFRAIKGYGLGVLVRSDPRPTSADVWLRPPDEVGQFLRDWLAVCGAGK